MLDQQGRSTIAPTAGEYASLRRVGLVTVIALVAPVAVGYLSVLVTGGVGWSVHGFGAFAGISLLWFLGGAILIRLGRVRSVWLGVLFMLLPAIGSALSGQSGFGALIALGLGALAGILGVRGTKMLLVPHRGYVLILILSIIAVAPIVAMSKGTPEQALRGGFNDQVLARYDGPRANEVFMLVPSNSFSGKFGRDLRLVHAQRAGRYWRLTQPRETSDPLFDGRNVSRQLRFPAMFGSDPVSVVTVPDDCALPLVYVVPGLELAGNCWLPQFGIVAGVAPGRSRVLEMTMRDGRVVHRQVRPVEGFGPGFLIPYLDRNGGELPHSAQPLRVAFRDSTGVLLDARPSMRFAHSWYQGIASLFDVKICRSGHPGSYSCPPKEQIQPQERIYRVLASLALLRPEEYRTICRKEPPAGDWVVLARVDLSPEHLFIDQDLGRDFTGGKTVRFVSAGVRLAGDHPSRWLDLSSARITTASPCFPGASSAPDLHGSS